MARLPPLALSMFRTIVGSGESGFKRALDRDFRGDGVLGGWEGGDESVRDMLGDPVLDEGEGFGGVDGVGGVSVSRLKARIRPERNRFDPSTTLSIESTAGLCTVDLEREVFEVEL